MPKGHTTMGALRACRFEGVIFSEAGELIQGLHLLLTHFLSPGLARIRSKLMRADRGDADLCRLSQVVTAA